MCLERIYDSWYPLARSVDLKKGNTTPLSILGHDLVLFRSLNNQVGALRRNCPHMGGDLSRGRVTDSGLACPIHQWEFSHSGKRITNSRDDYVPTKSCQASIRCCERWGLVFGYFGDVPYFELPNTQSEVFSAAPAVSDVNIHYTVPSLFGFDSEHFTTVHHRMLTDMNIYENQRGHIGTTLTTQVGNKRWSDRVLQRLGLDTVDTDIDYWAGNIVLGRHRKTRTYALITTLPLEKHRSRVFVVTMQEKPAGNLLTRGMSWCRFQLARPLINAFIRQDENALEGVRFEASSSRHRQDNPVNSWLTHVGQLPSTLTKDILQ